MAQIIFDHVTKKFGDEAALENVSFEIEKGEFVFILGRSGAGKSTLLNLIIKQEEATSGKITVNGHRVDIMKRKKIPAHRSKIGIVSQDVGLLKDRSVYDNIIFALMATEHSPAKMKKIVMRVLGLVGLVGKAQSFPDELSGGEQARVLLARALSTSPEILIADEPTANLDPDASWDMMQLLAEVNYQGMTVVVASHARDLVTIMKRRCISLVSGVVVADERNSIYDQKAMDIFEERRILGRK